MSLLSLLVEALGDGRTTGDLHDQHLGLGLLAEELLKRPRRHSLVPFTCGYVRPWRFNRPSEGGVFSLQNTKESFKVCLDVQQFMPEDLKVKVVDGFLVVEASHDERRDEHGFVSRQFTRRYRLDKDINIDELTSTLSSDGVLVLEAPKIELPEQNGREIPITHTNEPAVKRAEEDEDKSQDKTED